MYIDERKKPQVFGAGSFGAALAVHLVLFLLLWYAGSLRATERPEAIPIELMVVVNENLDGVDDEPPPERPPEPEPESPKPDPPKAPDPPKPPPPPPEAVIQTPAKTNVVKKVEKKEDAKPPEPPKETREERMARMRKSATKVKDAPPPRQPPRSNGRTERRPEDWEKLLMAGYRPGATNQGLDASEDQRCKFLIQQAFHDKWESPPWNDRLREMHLSVQFGPGGEVRGYRLVQSSGDPAADKSVLRAASLVPAVRGLSPAFLEANKTVTVRFKVTPM